MSWEENVCIIMIGIGGWNVRITRGGFVCWGQNVRGGMLGELFVVLIWRDSVLMDRSVRLPSELPPFFL